MKIFVICLLAGAFMYTGHIDAQQVSDLSDPEIGIVKSVEDWNVPFDERWSRDPYVAPDGSIYFVGQWTHYVGRFNPVTEEFREYELDDGTGPHTVVVSSEGAVWFTSFSDDHIGSVDPESGEVVKYETENYLRGPHTIAFDRNENFWFTAYRGNGIGHFDVSTGEITGLEVPTPGGTPYGIVMSPDMAQPWFGYFGSNRIATVNPESMEIEEVVLPREEIRVRRLNVTSDGRVWYGDYAGGMLGVYDPSDGSIREWPMPHGEDSRPYAVLTDDRDRLWISATGLNPNHLVLFDTVNEEFQGSVEIPVGRGAIRNMNFDPENRAIWFGTDIGYIGRLVID
ncbi:MAG: hypothetical protein WDZ29_01485 [Balneolaceae bacterium]